MLGLTLITAVACTDFLNHTPYDAVGTDLVYKSKDLAESAVIGVYSNVLYDYTSAELSRLNWDAFAGVIDPAYDNFFSNYSYMNGNIQPNASMFLTYWKRLYEGVSRANEVIMNLPEAKVMDEDMKARRLAEVKFLRAYHYYKLNALWGGVPYYGENLAPQEYDKSRSTQDEVWDYIIEDLTYCIECESLPEKYSGSSADFGRVTKGAAYALRGKVYMWKKMWAEAEKDFLKVKEAGYALVNQPYADVFKLKNETSDEIIFSARMVELSGCGNVFSRTYGSWPVAGKAGNNTFYMNQQFVDSYQTVAGKDFDWDEFIPGYSSMTPEARSVYFLRDGLTEAEKADAAAAGADMSKYLATGNEARIKAVYQNRDPRLMASVITPYSTYEGGYGGTEHTYTRAYPFRTDGAPEYDLKTMSHNTMFFYPIRKFVTVGLECMNETFNPVDVPIIRYASVLIDLAECANEQNRIGDVVTYLNQVRDRAGVGKYSTSDIKNIADAREKIMWERRWELALEEVLYYDELRQGTWKEFRFAENNGLAEPWGAPMYTTSWGGDAYNYWPIPQSEVQKAGGNIIQNDGWN